MGIQESKCVPDRSREIARPRFKIWYTSKDEYGTRVGVIVDKYLKEKVIEVLMKGDRIGLFYKIYCISRFLMPLTLFPISRFE